MPLYNWIDIGVFLLTQIGFVWGVFTYLDNRLKDYERTMDDKFVRRDMCKVLHEQTALNLGGLEGRIEKRFDKLELLIKEIQDGKGIH